MAYDLIEEYLIHSYLYYVLGDIVIDDFAFDRLCIELTASWDNISSPFKDEVNIPDDMEEFQLKGQDGQEDCYSEEIKYRARIRLREYEEMVDIWKNIPI